MATRGLGTSALLDLAAALLLVGLGAWSSADQAAPPQPNVPFAASPTSNTDSAASPAPNPDSTGANVEPPVWNSARAVASYQLRARLDPVTHRIEASGTITLRNHSTRALDDLYLHLYLNAFKNSETLFARSPFQAGRGGRKTEEWGYCQVTKLATASQDLWSRREYPLANDETDVRIRLLDPLPSGETLTLEVAFNVLLPEIVERTGFSRDYHLVAQWFPKLARLEPSGEWAHFSFHPQSEFYADFGDYDVTLEVPESFVMGATGDLVEESSQDGMRTMRYVAQGVHDFAWVAWPDFRVRAETIEGVRVRLLYPEGHARNAELELAAVRFGLEHYGRLYGRYPYPTLTVVHPPRHARDSGGMEYPTLITTGGSWYASAFGRSIELVTLHELAHQWFYGLLASNEHQYPFLDEGLASYAELVAAREWFGAGGAVDQFGLQVSVESLHRVGAARVSGAQSVGLGAAEFASFRQLGGLVYSRTATLLATLARVYGEEPTERALRRYTAEYRFRHPTPESLLDVIASELGADAREQARRVLFERGTVNYQLAELTSVETPGRLGLFGDGLEQNSEAAPGGFSSRALVVRRGTVFFPVSIEIGYEDGSIGRHSWDGLGEVFEALDAGPSRAAWARVDPELRVPLDDDLLDNTKALSVSRSARSTERLGYLAELAARSLGP